MSQADHHHIMICAARIALRAVLTAIELAAIASSIAVLVVTVTVIVRAAMEG